LYLTEPTQRFVSASGGHHHLICSTCGATIEFEHCSAGELVDKLAQEYGFEIHSHLLEFYGLCQGCR
ncbi:MAG: transcriptional repressor, partial [Chloroflexota bacterium]